MPCCLAQHAHRTYFVSQNTLCVTCKACKLVHSCTGPEAQEILQQVTDDPSHTSLIQFTRTNPHFKTRTGYASVLSTQSHAVGGSMVNTLLVQHTEPEAHLDAQQVTTPLRQGPCYLRGTLWVLLCPCFPWVDFTLSMALGARWSEPI